MNNNLRQQYLDVIGIQSWQLKSTLDDGLIEPEIVQEIQPYEEPQSNEEPQPNKEPQPYQKSQTTIIETQQTVNSESIAALVNKETDNDKSVPSQNKIIDEPTVDKESIETKTTETAKNEFDPELNQIISHCKKCSSRNTRLNALAGQGSAKASVFIISGAPSAEEDQLGKYLVGQSDTLFQAMMQSVGFENSYYFTGLIKCYSMENFLFSEQDISNCIPYLHSQIEQINPSVIFVLGAAEAQAVLDTKQSFNELRGKIHHISINEKDYSVIVSYHPAYLLRNPLYKRESLNDLIMVKNILK